MPLNCRKRPSLQALCRGSGLRRGGELGRGEGHRRFRPRIRIESIQLPDSSPPSPWWRDARRGRSEEHTSELQSLMRNSYAVFCLKKKKKENTKNNSTDRPTRTRDSIPRDSHHEHR